MDVGGIVGDMMSRKGRSDLEVLLLILFLVMLIVVVAGLLVEGGVFN